MKPLTIEQLKALELGDWVWIKVTNGQSVSISPPKYESYICIVNNTETALYNQMFVFKYSDYGKTWLAYKNKEQAEAKGEIMELPCKVGDTIYAIVDKCLQCEEDAGDYCACNKFKYKIYTMTVNSIRFDRCGYVLTEDSGASMGSLSEYCFEKDFNKKWFIEKAEAEAKLAELKGEK